MLLVTNGLFVYQLFKLVELDTSMTAEEKEELEIRKTPALFTGFNLHLYNFPLKHCHCKILKEIRLRRIESLGRAIFYLSKIIEKKR